MVERQLRARGIEDERVLEAMGAVPRELFVPRELCAHAYSDRALGIGEGQTISQPWIVARMAMLLELGGEERVLEVGTGSGYAAAVLARLCREVVSVERHPSLAERARAALAAGGVRNVEVRVGDGALGLPGEAPFGGISVAATARGRVPRALVEQLAPEGTLVCPVRRRGGETLIRLREGREERVASVRFVPLVQGEVEG